MIDGGDRRTADGRKFTKAWYSRSHAVSRGLHGDSDDGRGCVIGIEIPCLLTGKNFMV